MIHVGDVLFKALRGGYDTQLSPIGHNDRRGIPALGSHVPNIADPGAIIYISAESTVANTNSGGPGGDPFSGKRAQRDVGSAGGDSEARAIAHRGVAVT